MYRSRYASKDDSCSSKIAGKVRHCPFKLFPLVQLFSCNWNIIGIEQAEMAEKEMTDPWTLGVLVVTLFTSFGPICAKESISSAASLWPCCGVRHGNQNEPSTLPSNSWCIVLVNLTCIYLFWTSAPTPSNLWALQNEPHQRHRLPHLRNLQSNLYHYAPWHNQTRQLQVHTVQQRKTSCHEVHDPRRQTRIRDSNDNRLHEEPPRSRSMCTQSVFKIDWSSMRKAKSYVRHASHMISPTIEEKAYQSTKNDYKNKTSEVIFGCISSTLSTTSIGHVPMNGFSATRSTSKRPITGSTLQPPSQWIVSTSGF